MTHEYSLMEMMTVSASMEIRNREVAFVGTGLPMLAAMLAQRTHAPECVIVFEAGAIDCRLSQLPMSVGDSRAARRSSTLTGLFDVFSTVLQGGYIDVGFLSGAQVDAYGNLNSTSVGDYHSPSVRFPGSGGACDIACLSRRTIVIAMHERRRFPEKCDYVTSPGWIDGDGGRKRAGLTEGGPSAVITDLGVMRFDDSTRRMYLHSLHPGVTREQVCENTGFDIDVTRSIETEPPSEEYLRILREEVDPERIFLK